MKAQAQHRSHEGPGRRSRETCWLPAAPSRALDLTHWQSRAARGHTWNAGASTRRRRPH